MKQIDTGGASFSRIRDDNMYFVDKTLLIKEILDTNVGGVNLFTRPRRFGKTTNLTMLDAFFNIAYKGNNWFDGLKISEYPQYDEYKNAFPVVYLNLKDTVTDDYKKYIGLMRNTILETYKKHLYLRDSDTVTDDEKRLFKTLFEDTISEMDLSFSLKTLCGMLQRYHNKKVVILIDEYDRAVQDAFGSESHRPMMNFLGNFLSATLKNNEYTQLACVTGVMRIAKASIFSGLNNLKVYDIFSKKHDEMFGFTEDEVKELFEYYGHPEKFPEAKEWYDGYRFGDVDVYNPYSIMNYVSDDFEPKNYWGETGGRNSILADLYERVSSDVFNELHELAIGGTIEAPLTASLSYDGLDADSDTTIYSVMAMAGYLNASAKDENSYLVSLPNKEIKNVLKDTLKTISIGNKMIFGRFCRAMEDGNIAEMDKNLRMILKQGSYLNLKSEDSYELVLMTILIEVADRYEIKTETEGGNGRIDVILRPKNKRSPNIIFELKKVSSEKELESAVDDAIEQIKKMHYFNELSGKTVLYGLAFWGKIPSMKMEVLEL